MILSGLFFVTFVSVLGTFGDNLPTQDSGSLRLGSSSSRTRGASSTYISRRYRHRKVVISEIIMIVDEIPSISSPPFLDHERISRSHVRNGGRTSSTHQPQIINQTSESGNSSSTPPPPVSNSTLPIPVAVNATSNSTTPLGSGTSAAVNVSGKHNASLASPTPTVVNEAGNSTGSLPSNTSTASAPLASATARGDTTGLGLKANTLNHNGIYLGFLPDGGDAGGTRQTMASINSVVGKPSSTYGWYGQAISGILFDGAQLLAVMDDVKKSNAIFQPAVMPMKGWKGLTSSDNSQAVAIAQVMKKFTDQGIAVWLRFAHEMNYYQTDGTYVGNAADFKAGWAAVAAACKSIAPEVKMWWTPNVASMASYAQYAPDDMTTVDLVGIDFYPKSLSTGKEFINTMKAFHDQYAVDGRKFAIGETGLGYAGTPADRLSWLSQVTSASSEMKNYVSAAWFNYNKGYDYQIVSEQTPSLTSEFKSFLAA
ncbi:hypothetical protein PSTT_12754 [Puccinia striiformis]|uniref:GH26 domain-containing protein n=2 Tax=Puccinia striiformis TaxID=27350 RepID=A0A0L0VKV9_9BASI|nr:hypothetical protein PSTG_07133 [Puccinia striiformis f. sp. tritici PST-78]POW01062.1 hypothetical protein PSTT_12754 [Puccinia striiformis]